MHDKSVIKGKEISIKISHASLISSNYGIFIFSWKIKWTLVSI